MLPNFMILAFFLEAVLLYNFLKETSVDLCSLFIHTGAEIKKKGKRMSYSVFRRSIPQNFEEYIVTAPR